MQKQCLKTKNVLIMASGNGSNFEAIVKYFQSNGFSNKVNFELLCDKKNANVFKRAEKLCVPANFVEFSDLYDFLDTRKGKYDLYVLAGFMRILPEKILKICSYGAACTQGCCSNIVNIHPSLLPEFKGKNAIKRAFEAGVDKTGVTIHFVDKNVDAGRIIAQKSIDTEDFSLLELEDNIHKIEHLLFPKTIEKLLFKKNVLIFGGGAREHAIASAISVSPFLNGLFLAKPNDGFKHLGETIDFADYSDLLNKALEKKIDILVVGPENPLCEGITDIFEAYGIKVIGANKKWAMLEGSKSFAKEFMQRNGIKTGEYRTIDFRDNKKQAEFNQAFDYFEKSDAAPVIKADGLALGKGVYIPQSIDDAKNAAKEFLDGKFGEASKKILLEERLFGREVSVISLWDGKTLVSFPPASDYKRLLDDDKGLNTGGMGAVAPREISAEQKTQIDNYLKTLESALKNECADFCGVVYSGLILIDNGVKVLEYNMRFGDPECQVLLELLDTERGADLLDIFIKMTEGKLAKEDLKIADKKAYCVVLASEGYPENPKKGALIKNLGSLENLKGSGGTGKSGCKVYYAGVKNAKSTTLSGSKTLKNSLITNGGRVLSIVKSAKDADSALEDVYKTAEIIEFDGKIYRTDIGKSRSA